jgi:hypothetical protein
MMPDRQLPIVTSPARQSRLICSNSSTHDLAIPDLRAQPSGGAAARAADDPMPRAQFGEFGGEIEHANVRLPVRLPYHR